MSNVIFYYTNPAKIDILISKLTQNLQQSIGVEWVFQHNFPKHSSYEERSTVREILHNNSASVVWHRLSFNLIELYITDVFSLSPDIDFLHAQLFYSYVCQSDDSHSNELLLQSGCTSFYYFITTTIASSFIGLTKIERGNAVGTEIGGLNWKFGMDFHMRLSCKRKWSTHCENITFHLQIKFIRLFGIFHPKRHTHTHNMKSLIQLLFALPFLSSLRFHSKWKY